MARRGRALHRRYGRSHPATIKILGRDYSVDTRPNTRHPEEGVVYVLTGKRGAKYATMRNKPRPEHMFLAHAERGFGIPAGFEGVWLTDKNGTLEVLR
jgi:hypothetical protein